MLIRMYYGYMFGDQKVWSTYDFELPVNGGDDVGLVEDDAISKFKRDVRVERLAFCGVLNMQEVIAFCAPPATPNPDPEPEDDWEDTEEEEEEEEEEDEEPRAQIVTASAVTAVSLYAPPPPAPPAPPTPPTRPAPPVRPAPPAPPAADDDIFANADITRPTTLSDYLTGG